MPEAAAAVGLSISTIRRLIQSGRLPARFERGDKGQNRYFIARGDLAGLAGIGDPGAGAPPVTRAERRAPEHHPPLRGHPPTAWAPGERGVGGPGPEAGIRDQGSGIRGQGSGIRGQGDQGLPGLHGDQGRQDAGAVGGAPRVDGHARPDRHAFQEAAPQGDLPAGLPARRVEAAGSPGVGVPPGAGRGVMDGHERHGRHERHEAREEAATASATPGARGAGVDEGWRPALEGGGLSEAAARLELAVVRERLAGAQAATRLHAERVRGQAEEIRFLQAQLDRSREAEEQLRVLLARLTAALPEKGTAPALEARNIIHPLRGYPPPDPKAPGRARWWPFGRR